MKKIMLACMGLCAGTLLAAEPAKPAKGGSGTVGAAQTVKSAKAGKMTFEKACEYITEVVKNPSLMGEITQQLTAEDQKKFLIEVNKAIVSMPGSNEQKTATFLNVNREALLAAEKGNLQAMVATMFKSVTLESLTVLADRYAEDLFNRDADASKKFTDEQFTEIASSTVKEVAKEVADLSDAAPRDTLAIYLFEKASNDTIPELEDKLLEVAISDPQTREVAKNEWLAQAKSESGEKFSSLLGYAEAGREPNVDVVLKIAGPQIMTAVLNDLSQGVMDSNGNQIMPVTQGEGTTGRETATVSQTAEAVTTAASDTKPKTSADVPYNPSYSRQEVEKAQEEEKREPEPKPYPYQD